MPEQVLDVVAEDVEEVAVAEQVGPAPVQQPVRGQGVAVALAQHSPRAELVPLKTQRARDRGQAGVADRLAAHARLAVGEIDDPAELKPEHRGQHQQQTVDHPRRAASRVLDLDRQLHEQLRRPDRAASGPELAGLGLTLAGRALGQLVALVTVEPDALADRAVIDGRADLAGQIVLAQEAAAAWTLALARSRVGVELGLDVGALAREPIELTRVEPCPVADRAGVDLHLGRRIDHKCALARLDLSPAPVLALAQQHRHQLVQPARRTLSIDLALGHDPVYALTSPPCIPFVGGNKPRDNHWSKGQNTLPEAGVGPSRDS